VLLGVTIMAVHDRKDERLEARCAPEVKERIEHAAALQGRSMTDFVVSAADEQACKVIEQHKVIKLCAEDSIALAEAILNPPKPNSKAIDAAVRAIKRKNK